MGFLFRYHARDKDGKGKDGTIEAINEDAAVRKLQAQGLFVIAVNEAQKERRIKERRTKIRRIKDRATKEKIKERVTQDRVTKERRIKERRTKIRQKYL